MVPNDADFININASMELLDISDEAGVKRFIFASTCSTYGKMVNDETLTEDSTLRPLSLYAVSKVTFENYMQAKPYDHVTPCILRFATVYGKSPRMRFDLTINDFVRELHLGKELQVFGADLWRPYCHVDDLALSILLALKTDKEAIYKQVFNIGSNDNNFKKSEIVDKIQKVYPNSKVEYVNKDEDPRSYRVNFDKAKKVLGFEPTKTIEDGIEEIKELLDSGVIEDTYENVYRNS